METFWAGAAIFLIMGGVVYLLAAVLIRAKTDTSAQPIFRTLIPRKIARRRIRSGAGDHQRKQNLTRKNKVV